MKKLLSLLSVLTISGTAVPTTIAAGNYDKQETNLKTLNRVKRNCNGDYNSVEEGGIFIKNYYVSFVPKTFKNIISNYNKNSNNYQNFNKDVQNIFFTDPLLDFYQIDNNTSSYTYNEIEYFVKIYAKIIAKAVWNDWNKIISVWNNGDKKHRIRTVVDCGSYNVSYLITSENMINNERVFCFD
ncbi:hypothetical protein [Spiroplasma endosymbiont of Polydrusus formosus]|uniref:hypothetical protein n=1 Tax=Spiroplasma endosymbiont of Polydrusus formosus TaxID=3139326 RepID=UPI0035B538D9